MSLKSRKELLAILRAQYEAADRRSRGDLIDSLVRATGYNRKYAIELLGQKPSLKLVRTRRKKYTEAVTNALVKMWNASNHLCSKRLVSFIPLALPSMERAGQVKLAPSERKLLLSMSAATIDRHLSANCDRPKSPSLTKAGSLSRNHIAVKTFSQWTDTKPGFLEIDTVGHCGGSLLGEYCHTLTLTDVATGWTELFVLPAKTEEAVVNALNGSSKRLPFSIKGIDSDNGTEFMNAKLILWSEKRRITFTKSRPYRKNDQCYVEQKNGAVVRKFVGHDRFTGARAQKVLESLYELASLYVNYFQPSTKLIYREKISGRWKKTYDVPKTPFERLKGYRMNREQKQQQLELMKTLNPCDLLAKIRKCQKTLHSLVKEPRNQDSLFASRSTRLNRSRKGHTAAVLAHIETIPHAQKFSSANFEIVGLPSVYHILRRLAAKGLIERVGHGKYCRRDQTVTQAEMRTLRTKKRTPKLISNG